jgi:hypothetical protein
MEMDSSMKLDELIVTFLANFFYYLSFSSTFDTTKKSAYRGGFKKLKTASIDYQTASIDMNVL